MRVVLAGGSGFLGGALAGGLASQGDDVVILSRDAGNPPHGRAVAWRPNGSTGPWSREIDGADAVVNLAGAGIADKRWTPERKKLLEESRVLSTRSLVTAVRDAARKPAVFIQGSAVGYYGAHEAGPPFDESSLPGEDYLAHLSEIWEAEAMPARDLGCRLVIVRTGIVLARDEGALAKMATPFKLFVGGPVASGRQYLSWIHVDDWVSLVMWALRSPAVLGPINATAPTPVTNREFSTALGKALGRPSWAPVPAFVLRLIFGEMADTMLVRGQRVMPARTKELGFAFKHEHVGPALESIFRM